MHDDSQIVASQFSLQLLSSKSSKCIFVMTVNNLCSCMLSCTLCDDWRKKGGKETNIDRKKKDQWCNTKHRSERFWPMRQAGVLVPLAVHQRESVTLFVSGGHRLSLRQLITINPSLTRYHSMDKWMDVELVVVVTPPKIILRLYVMMARLMHKI